MSRLMRSRIDGILEAREHLVEAAFAHPQRQAGVEAVRRAIVGIHVGGDVEPAGAGRVECFKHFRHAAPVGLVGGLEVPHFGGNVRALGHGEHLVERRR